MSTDWRLDVLACPTTGGRLSGTWPQLRNSQGQAIDVDGITNLTPGGSIEPGEFVKVEIVDALEHALIGRVRGCM